MCALYSRHTPPPGESSHTYSAPTCSLYPPYPQPHENRRFYHRTFARTHPQKTFGGVVQVAALLCGADGEVLSTLACLVRPGLKAIEPGATKVHGITQGKAMVYGLEIPALQGVAGRSMIAPMRVATCLSEWSLRWLELR